MQKPPILFVGAFYSIHKNLSFVKRTLFLMDNFYILHNLHVHYKNLKLFLFGI